MMTVDVTMDTVNPDDFQNEEVAGSAYVKFNDPNFIPSYVPTALLAPLVLMPSWSTGFPWLRLGVVLLAIICIWQPWLGPKKPPQE